jgi:threonine synthase
LSTLGASRAFAIRRRDASGYYAGLHSILKDGGLALDASEKDIQSSKRALLELENIDAGYTACTSLAAIRRESQVSGTFKGKRLLVMITGADRPTDIVPRIDRVISKSEWKQIIRKS